MRSENKIPQSVAIIMDGNGRWAENRGLERVQGHINGVQSVRSSLRAARRHGVRYLTLYAFSTENWGRPQQEVEALMELLCQSVVNESAELIAQGVAVKVIGDTSAMSQKVQDHLQKIVDTTASGDKLTLILALNYSSRHELTRATTQIAQEVANGSLKLEDIDQQRITNHLYTAPYPDPDLLIRTSGESRLSNFLLWQCAYTEFYFTGVLWPDFDEDQFDKALEEYAARDRRFGLVNKK